MIGAGLIVNGKRSPSTVNHPKNRALTLPFPTGRLDRLHGSRHDCDRDQCHRQRVQARRTGPERDRRHEGVARRRVRIRRGERLPLLSSFVIRARTLFSSVLLYTFKASPAALARPSWLRPGLRAASSTPQKRFSRVAMNTRPTVGSLRTSTNREIQLERDREEEETVDVTARLGARDMLLYDTGSRAKRQIPGQGEI